MTEALNTRFTYIYRDADNYKSHRSLIFEGILTKAELTDLYASTDKGSFLPGQVGLEALQEDLQGYDKTSNHNSDGEYDPYGEEGSDHPWHELQEDGFAIRTKEDSTESRSVHELLIAFKAAAGAWDEHEELKRIK